MTKKTPGKPRTYTIDQLDAMLLQFVQQNPNTQVSYMSLQKATGVGRNTWARNMKEKIDKINQPSPIIDHLQATDSLPLPNIAELVHTLYPNKDKLIEALYQVNRSLHKFYEQAKKNLSA